MRFIPKKTITVQLPIDVINRFNELRKELGLTKTKMVEKLIMEAKNENH